MPGQLDIFKTKRQRGVKALAPLEFPVHCMIADTLRLQCSRGWLWWHTPSGEKRAIQTAAKLKRMGVRKGVPDFLLVKPPFGHLIGLELKRKGEKPTQEQLDFGNALILAGGYWEWVDSYPEAIQALQRWGVLPTTIKVV